MRRLLGFLALSVALTVLAVIGNVHTNASGGDLALESGEDLSLRTVRSVTIKTGPGSRNTRIYSRDRFYRDGSAVLPVNIESTKEQSGPYTRSVDAGPYTYRYNPSDKSAGSYFEAAGYGVTFTPVGDWTGITTQVEPAAHGVKETVVFTVGASSEVGWALSSDAGITYENGALTFCDSAGGFLFRVPQAIAEDVAGKEVPVVTTFTGKTLVYRIAPDKDTVFPVMLDPSITIAPQEDGYILSANMDYSVAHDSTSGSAIAGHAVYVGQNENYHVYRSFLSFPLPALGTVSACSLYLNESANYSTGDFDIYILGASEYGPTFDAADFPHFDGHQPSGTYTGTPLNETWNSTSIDPEWNAIVFNAAGHDSLLAASGDTLWIALVSSDDYFNITPVRNAYMIFNGSLDVGKEPYLTIDYTPAMSPQNFTMSPVDTSGIICSWTDNSDNEERFLIVSLPDSAVIDTVAANAVSDTIYGLGTNTKYTWMAVADSAGLRGYSDPDSCYTLLPEPGLSDIRIGPISSDTLRVSVVSPANGDADSTGMEIDSVSGSGGSDSGWMDGEYVYYDSDVTGGSTYIYRIRFRNGFGVQTGWSPVFSYAMQGADSMTVFLSGDNDDGYLEGDGTVEADSPVVRVGAGDDGAELDGFLGFKIPWVVQKGGADSLLLHIARTDENADNILTIKVFGILDKYPGEIEEIDAGGLDSSSSHVDWTVSAGAGSKTSPDLRMVFREWQDTSPVRDRLFRFGLRLDGNAQADSVRAVFLDASNELYAANTSLTFYYAPGNPDTLEAAPSGMLIEVAGPDSLTVSWTDPNASEAGYVLLDYADSTQVAGTDTLAQDVTGTGVGGLTPNTVYQWFVRTFTGGEELSSIGVSARTEARTPGAPSVTAVSDSTIKFVIDPVDNPFYTEFAVQDSISGFYVDDTGSISTLRVGPPTTWGWQTYTGWGGAAGDTLGVFDPDSLVVIRVKARDGAQ